MKNAFRLGLLALLAAACGFCQSNDAVLQELLSEVRQLRQTLEKSITLGPRMQLLMQRAQMQDQKVARVAQQLEEVRKQIAGEAARQTRAQENLAKVEESISSETDAMKLKQLEDMRTQFKMNASIGPDPQLRAHESELNNSLQTEQAILDEINGKLDAFEKQLETLAAPRQ